MLDKIPQLTEDYFLSKFVGGLNDDAKKMVKLLKPSSLMEAYRLARGYETPARTSTPHHKSSHPTTYSNQPRTDLAPSINSKIPLLTNSSSTSSIQKSNPKAITATQRDERRSKGLCYHCNDKYVRGHQCKNPQTFMIVTEEQEEEGYDSPPIFDEAIPEEKGNQEDFNKGKEPMEVSLHALEGCPSPRTLVVTGYVGKKSFKILIDGGSTHNFLDPTAAKRLGCVMEPTTPMVVTIANGGKLLSNYQSKESGKVIKDFSSKMR